MSGPGSTVPATALPQTGPLQRTDLDAAELIFRRAFGTWLGAPEPENFFSDLDYVRGRFAAPHVTSLAVRLEGRLVGSNFVTRWGSVGFFGPLTVLPELQNQGLARALLEPTVAQFEAWGTRCAGLFTFAESTKHVSLYRRFGFLPRFLTVVAGAAVPPAPPPAGYRSYAALPLAERTPVLPAARAVTESLYPGLDLTAEIETVARFGLGDTVLLEGEDGLAAFAVCHHGPTSEAGQGACLIKFAAVRDGPRAAADYQRLLDACLAHAAAVGAQTLLAGVNTARREAWTGLLGRGFRPVMHGIAMHRDDEPGYSRPGLYALDDWR